MKQQSFMAFCKNYFGVKPGETIKEFAAELAKLELAKLSFEEKMQLAQDARAAGMDCADPTPPDAAPKK